MLQRLNGCARLSVGNTKALSTEDCYLFWLRRYIAALRRMPPELPSEKKLEQFLTDLALRHDVAASTQNQALHAILFFYKCVLGQPLANVDALRATRPVHERYASTVSETQALLQSIPTQGGHPQISSPGCYMAVVCGSASH